MEEILDAISSVGFPIAVAVFILIRIEPRLNKLSENITKSIEIINEIIPIVQQDTDNTRDVKDAINSLRVEIAKLNGGSKK